MEAADAEVGRYERATFELSATLSGVDEKNESPEQADEAARIYFGGANSCASAFGKNLDTQSRNPSSRTNPLVVIENAENELLSCLEKFGLQGRVFAKIGAREVGLQDFFTEYATALNDQQVARNVARATPQEDRFDWGGFLVTFGMVLAGSMEQSAALYKPSTVYVNPHIRKDGTFVSPHIRTAPNGYCFDNFSGCR